MKQNAFTAHDICQLFLVAIERMDFVSFLGIFRDMLRPKS